MTIKNTVLKHRRFLRSLILLIPVLNCATAEPFSLNGFPNPEQIKGVVFIDSAKEGSLLQLKGMAGKGVFVLPQQEESGCVALPLRFVAGDFGGPSIGIHSADPIRLVIYSEQVATSLAAGYDIVSEDYKITNQSDAMLGDIKISTTSDGQFGFVLNPGRWPWSGLFGYRAKPVACDWALKQGVASNGAFSLKDY